MIETIDGQADSDGLADAARLLHDFNEEYDEPTPPPAWLVGRLTELVEGGGTTVLLARDDAGHAVGVAVLRLQPSLWSDAQEAYLAELYVVPGLRGHGHGRELITEVIRSARDQGGADYLFLVTSEEDRLAQRLYEAAGFRRTEGDGGPPMWAYEMEL